MEIENILKLLSPVGVIAGVAKIIYEHSSSSKHKLRDDYRFAKDFLKDMEHPDGLHHLAVQRGYYALAGTTSINVTDIAYLISLENPDKSLKDYALARNYVEFNAKLNRVVYRPKVKSKFSRRWRQTAHFSAYFIFAYLSISPLILPSYYNLGSHFMWLAIATFPVFGFFAFQTLRSFIRIQRGEALVNEHKKHTTLIIIEKK